MRLHEESPLESPLIGLEKLRLGDIKYLHFAFDFNT
jgi:hypothetical protein